MSQQEISLFLEACGATGPLDLAVADTNGLVVGRWASPRPFTLIGRGPGTGPSLDHENVSKRHAYLQVLAGQVFCVDLESRSRITWGGVAASSGWLGPGEAIGIGPYLVRLAGHPTNGEGPPPTDHPPNPLKTRSSSWSDDGPPKAFLESDGRSGVPAKWRIRRVMALVGRAPACRFRIDDVGLSRYHCALLRLPGGTWVVDLLSREGTLVNGAPVQWSRLEEGDTLDVGRYRFRFRRESGTAVALPGPPDEAAVLPVPDQAGRASVPALRTVTGGMPALVQLDRPDAGDLSPGEGARIEAFLRPIVAQFGQMHQQMFEQFNQAIMTMFQMMGTQQRDQMGLVQREIDRIRQLTEQLQTLQLEVARTEASGGVAPERTPDAALDAPTARIQAPVRGREPLPDHKADRPARPRPVVADNGDTPDVHALLCQRIHELQVERQGRWQKLLGLVTGQGAGGPAA